MTHARGTELPTHGRDQDEWAAADALVRVADERDASVVVIGLRHRTPVGKLIMGSAAQRILLDARCPVLAVKEDTA